MKFRTSTEDCGNSIYDCGNSICFECPECNRYWCIGDRASLPESHLFWSKCDCGRQYSWDRRTKSVHFESEEDRLVNACNQWHELAKAAMND